jgi:Uma2 family endonuclease
MELCLSHQRRPEILDTTEKRATYEDLCSVPENMTGELIDGELIVTSEPSWKSHLAETLLADVLASYHSKDESGPGGWIILSRPRILMGDSILAPDLAGWRRERIPPGLEMDRISVVPDWVCEILSDDTVILDKTKKMPIYAQYGLSYLWLIDPQRKTLGLVSVYELEQESGHWVWLGGHLDHDKVRAVPFNEVELEFSALLRKLAVIVTKRQRISKSELLSRLRVMLEEGLSSTTPDEPTLPR